MARRYNRSACADLASGAACPTRPASHAALALDEDRALLAELDNHWQLPEDGVVARAPDQVREIQSSHGVGELAGKALAAEDAAAAQNPYRDWIETCAASGFEDLAATLEGLLERNAEDRPGVRSAYRRAMQLELSSRSSVPTPRATHVADR